MFVECKKTRWLSVAEAEAEAEAEAYCKAVTYSCKYL